MGEEAADESISSRSNSSLGTTGRLERPSRTPLSGGVVVSPRTLCFCPARLLQPWTLL